MVKDGNRLDDDFEYDLAELGGAGMGIGLPLGRIFWPLCMFWCEGTSGGYYHIKVPQQKIKAGTIAVGFYPGFEDHLLS